MAQSEAAHSLAQALINTSHLPLLLFDDEMRVVSASRSFCTAFDLRQEEVAGQTLAKLGGGEWSTGELRDRLRDAVLEKPEAGPFEMDLLAPGAPRRLVLTLGRVAYDDKLNIRILLAINDITAVREAERLNAALLLEQENLLRERSELMAEMQHRIANSLQIIASVLQIKVREVASEDGRMHLRDAHDRVMAIAAVQRHLQLGQDEVDLAPYLTKLCESLAASMVRDSHLVRLDVRADPAMVTANQATNLGLIVTELVINALKHAFPDGREGLVTVAYDLRRGGWTLSVTDDGVGRAPSPTARIGLGTSVVQSLARRLGARVEASDAGPGVRAAVVSLER